MKQISHLNSDNDVQPRLSHGCIANTFFHTFTVTSCGKSASEYYVKYINYEVPYHVTQALTLMF
jgi:hypothetical protein